MSDKTLSSNDAVKLEGIKLLLVDDEEEFVATLAERMQMRNLLPKYALNGVAALQMIDKLIPDVIILDLKMPGIDGLEVLRRVKSRHPQIQIIILTGHGSEKDEDEALRLGAFGYLKKPADIDELTKQIKNAYRLKLSLY